MAPKATDPAEEVAITLALLPSATHLAAGTLKRERLPLPDPAAASIDARAEKEASGRAVDEAKVEAERMRLRKEKKEVR